MIVHGKTARITPQLIAEPAWKRITREVAESKGVSFSDLIGTSRLRKFAHPRFLAMWRIRKETNFTYPQIAQRFSRRDHTSVIYAVRRAEELGLMADL